MKWFTFLWNFNSPILFAYTLFLMGLKDIIFLYPQAPLYIALFICYSISVHFFLTRFWLLLNLNISVIIKYHDLCKISIHMSFRQKNFNNQYTMFIYNTVFKCYLTWLIITIQNYLTDSCITWLSQLAHCCFDYIVTTVEG